MLLVWSGVFASLDRLLPKMLGDGGCEASCAGDESIDIASSDDVILSASLPLLLPGELGVLLNAAICFFGMGWAPLLDFDFDRSVVRMTIRWKKCHWNRTLHAVDWLNCLYLLGWEDVK